MKVKSFFEKHPVFRYEEFAQFMQKQGIKKSSSWRQQLSYYHKSGNLINIRRFLYAVKPNSVEKENYWVDPYLIAGKATLDSIIGYHTALELHNLAYTTFQELTFLTLEPNKSFAYQGQRFRPVKFPESLVKQNKINNNVDQIQRQGVKIKLTCLERTIVDVLDRSDLGGGWEEIWRSLDHAINFDPVKLINYTLSLNNSTIVAKVGFFLEQRPSHLAINPIHIKKLLPHIPKQPHYMNRDRRGKGKYYEKWQLIVPLEIIERKWEEPNDPNI